MAWTARTMPPFMSNTPGPVARPSTTPNGRAASAPEREDGVVVADQSTRGVAAARQWTCGPAGPSTSVAGRPSRRSITPATAAADSVSAAGSMRRRLDVDEQFQVGERQLGRARHPMTRAPPYPAPSHRHRGEARASGACSRNASVERLGEHRCRRGCSTMPAIWKLEKCSLNERTGRARVDIRAASIPSPTIQTQSTSPPVRSALARRNGAHGRTRWITAGARPRRGVKPSLDLHQRTAAREASTTPTITACHRPGPLHRRPERSRARRAAS